jgi:hypothetical protein
MKNILAIFIVFLILASYITLVLLYNGVLDPPKKVDASKSTGPTGPTRNNAPSAMDTHKCDITGCKMDPVSDPKYNMQQIVKQSILLEEHLANKKKRCRDCITKHFLHIIGLAEEAQMLATNKIGNYPLINECVELYNRLFKRWLESYDKNAEYCSLNCCDELRVMRKKLIAAYFFDT